MKSKAIMNNRRRDFLKTIVVGGAAGILSFPSCKGITGSTKITILHTNDVHSHIDPFPNNHKTFAGQGGYARRFALIKQIRKEEKNVLLLDSGDIFQGTPYFNFYKGELDIKLMNTMKYDAATIGNHEFDNGEEELGKQISKATFPFIVSNYELNYSSLKGLTKPYKIIQKDNIRIGIIGIGIELKGLVDPTHFKNIDCLNPVQISNNIASFLKSNEKCDYVIALSHLGYEYMDDKVSDITLAKNTSDIDLILGGHTHTFLEQPTFILNNKNKLVTINQTGWGGIKLGRIDLVFDAGNSQSRIVNHNLL